MNEFILKTVGSFEEIEALPFLKLNCFHWEEKTPYRPEAFAKVCIFRDSLVAVLKCYEKNPKTVIKERDGRIWCDSCLEFFVRPVSTREEYINTEVNSEGYFLSQFGSSRENRVFLKELTDEAPIVESFRGTDEKGYFWGVRITLTKSLISTLYKINPEEILFDEIYANFFKCGDECEIPHYVAMFPVTTLPPGFHNPACFKKFTQGEI